MDLYIRDISSMRRCCESRVYYTKCIGRSVFTEKVDWFKAMNMAIVGMRLRERGGIGAVTAIAHIVTLSVGKRMSYCVRLSSKPR